jgi:hypothetical protein
VPGKYGERAWLDTPRVIAETATGGLLLGALLAWVLRSALS